MFEKANDSFAVINVIAAGDQVCGIYCDLVGLDVVREKKQGVPQIEIRAEQKKSKRREMSSVAEETPQNRQALTEKRLGFFSLFNSFGQIDQKEQKQKGQHVANQVERDHLYTKIEIVEQQIEIVKIVFFRQNRMADDNFFDS